MKCNAPFSIFVRSIYSHPQINSGLTIQYILLQNSAKNIADPTFSCLSTYTKGETVNWYDTERFPPIRDPFLMWLIRSSIASAKFSSVSSPFVQFTADRVFQKQIFYQHRKQTRVRNPFSFCPTLHRTNTHICLTVIGQNDTPILFSL